MRAMLAYNFVQVQATSVADPAFINILLHIDGELPLVVTAVGT